MKGSLNELAAVARAALDRTPLQIAPADWDALIRAANEHGMTVMLARGLRGATLPAAVRERLEQGSRARTERALRTTRQLRRLIDALNAQGIPVLSVKGPVLAATAYGDVTLRGASLDLDLVVRKSDLDRAIRCIEAEAYRRVEPGIDEHDHEQWESEAHLFPDHPGVLVELHTDLIGSFHTTAMDLDAVFARSSERTLFGATLRVLAPEDLLLYLALHAGRHFWSRLLWICDLGALIRTMPLDWDVVAQRAAAIDARQRLAAGLHLAARMTGAAIPEQMLREPRVRTLTALAVDRMQRTSRGLTTPGLALKLLYELAGRETARQRRIYLGRQIAPNARDRAWVDLPRGLGWLRYLLRPLRVLRNYGKSPEPKERA